MTLMFRSSHSPLQRFFWTCFSFSFRFSILLIKVIRKCIKEKFSRIPTFFITMILRQQSKLRALKQTVSLNTVSLISYSNELQPYVQQNNIELNCTQKAGLGLNSDEHKKFHSSWLEIKLRFLLHFFYHNPRKYPVINRNQMDYIPIKKILTLHSQPWICAANDLFTELKKLNNRVKPGWLSFQSHNFCCVCLHLHRNLHNKSFCQSCRQQSINKSRDNF